MKVHDIRQQIPQFNANYFPPYEFRPYPKMMINPETKKPYLDKAKNVVLVNDEHEEKLFLAQHYKPEAAPAAQTVEIAAVEEPIKRGPGRPPMPKNLTA